MTTVKDSIAKNMIKFGSPVLEKESVYDWADPWAVNHILGVDVSTAQIDDSQICGWISPKVPELEEVFVTLYAGPYNMVETEKMLQMCHFDCACGQYKDVTIRYAGEASEFLIALMQDAD